MQGAAFLKSWLRYSRFASNGSLMYKGFVLTLAELFWHLELHRFFFFSFLGGLGGGAYLFVSIVVGYRQGKVKGVEIQQSIADGGQ